MVICQRACEEEEVVPVSRTVHGLQGEDVFLHREGEHVVAVVLPVARRLPQFAVVDVGRGHLLEASPPVLILKRRHRSRPSLSIIDSQGHSSIQTSPQQDTRRSRGGMWLRR